ncbi:MAG: hypothetical protein OHK003_30880 [Anaerolineales bacterium]
MRGFTLWSETIRGKKYREYAVHQANNYAAVFQTYKSDIVLFEKKVPGKREELDALRLMVDKQLVQLLREVCFWNASPSTKLKILLRDYLRTGYVRTAVRLLVTWMLPVFLSTWQQFYVLRHREKLSHFKTL